LEGIKVVELGSYIVVPAAAAALADWGAEVIKIEEPKSGDGFRRMPPGRTVSQMLEQENHSKKSLTVDITKDAGREIVYELVRRADVFATNLPEEVLKRRKLDYETLSKLNDRLIYAQNTGYGEKGPDADERAFDLGAYWCRGGIMASLGEPDSIPPFALGGVGDHPTAMHLVAGILLALIAREKTGFGQKVQTSLLGSAVWTAAVPVNTVLITGRDYQRTSRKAARNPLSNSYQTKDGRWIQLTMLEGDRFWSELCKALDIEHLQQDPKFDTQANRAANNVELISILDEVFATKTKEEWESRFESFDLIWAPVNTIAEVIADPQVVANEYLVEMEHPSGDKIKIVAFPVQLSKTPAKIKSATPSLGQHTEEILLALGYTKEKIQELREAGVV
jgi:crotonobetainyl-CoA:carnitine CoA-transferase CaiB-like acyl-CoA transferase